MKRFLLVLAFIAGTSIIYAQTILKGTIKDNQTNLPVEGASVSISNTSIATTTNAQGNFTLRSKKAFDKVTVSSIGYTTQYINLSNHSDNLVILLQPVSRSLAAVEVLGVRQPQAVNTLTESELHRYSGLSLQDALNTIPGVSMSSRTPWGGQHIIIRGYYPSTDNGRSNSENFAGLGYQLFIDNIPVTDATGTTVMDDIDFLNLGRVEVIKGPSPLFGSYIAGAVNLFSPRPIPNQSSIVEQAMGGSYGLFRNNTTIQTSNGNSDIRVNYGHQAYTGFRPHSDSRKDYLSFTTNLNVNDKNAVSTYFSYNNSYEDLAGEIDSADFYARKAVSNNFYVLNNSHVAIESFRAGITDKYQFTSRFSNQTTVFATGSTLNQAFAHGFTKNQNMGFGGRTAFMYETNGSSLDVDATLGVAFQRTNQDAHGNFIPPFVLPPFTPATVPNIGSAARNYAMNYNLFTQWKFSLPSQVSLTVGGSLNFIEFANQNLLRNGTLYLDNPVNLKVFKPVFTPNVSLIKVFNSYLSLYGSLGAGYAPPTLGQMTNTDGKVNADLKPEKAIQYEIGTKGSVGKEKKLSYQLALFDLDVTDRLIQQTANSVSFYTNAGEQRNLGVEAFISYSAITEKNSFVSLFRPWLSYSYSDFKYIDFKNHAKSSSGGDTVVADYAGKKVAAVPANAFNIGIDLAARPGLYFSATCKYVDKVPVTFTNSNYMKAYSLLSAKLGFKKQFGYHFGFDAFVGADNLLGSTYYNLIFVGQNIQELAQANDPFITGGGGDGYILPAPYKATFYGGATLKYNF